MENWQVQIKPENGPPRMVPVFNLWMKWEGRRFYSEGLCFEPKVCRASQFNMYQRNHIIPAPGDVSAFKWFLEHVVCSGNKRHFRYLWKWMAYMYQFPGGPRLCIALILLGDQGTGKGTFWRIFSELFKPHIYHETNQDLFLDKFNTLLANNILIFNDEATPPRDRKGQAMIKGFISEPNMTVNPKGIKPYVVSNHANLIIASNNAEVYPVGSNDRRPFILRVSDCRRQNRDYFGRLLDIMFKEGGIQALAYDLLQEDVSDMLTTNVPRTQWMAEQYEFAATSEEKFLLEVLNKGSLHLSRTDDWRNRVSKSELFAEYRNWCGEEHHKWPLSSRAFGRRVCSLLPVKEGKAPDPWGNGKQVNAYLLPGLNECRRHFCSKVGHDIDWAGIDEVSPPQDLQSLTSAELLPPAVTEQMAYAAEMFE